MEFASKMCEFTFQIDSVFMYTFVCCAMHKTQMALNIMPT